MKENKKTKSSEQVFGNERYGIPTDYTKKQKFSGVKLFCYIVVVAVLCSALYGAYQGMTDYLLPEMHYDTSYLPLLYVKNSDMLIKRPDDRRASVLASSDALYRRSHTPNAAVTEDGRFVFFAQENPDTKEGFDLCYRKVSDLDDGAQPSGETITLDTGVTDFLLQPAGQFVLYLKKDRLYLSDLKRTRILAAGVTEYDLSRNSQKVLYYKDGGVMYAAGTGKGELPTLIDDGITKLVSEKNAYADIYYIKEGALYHKETPERESVCVAEDVQDAIMLGEYVYFTRQEERAVRFSELFYDDFAASDALLKAPQKAEFLNEAEFFLAEQAYSEKLARDVLRTHFAQNPVVRTENVLYTVKRGEVKQIDTNLSYPALSFHSSKQVICYRKKTPPEEKITLSTVLGVSDAEAKAYEKLAEINQDSMQVLVKDKMPYPALSTYPSGQIEISLDGNYLYCIEEKGEDGRGTLVRYSVTARALKNRTVLKDGVTDFALDGADSSVVLAFDEERLGLVMGDTYTHLSDRSCHQFFYVDGTLYFYDDYDFETASGQLKYFRNGKIKLVDVNVHDFSARNLKTVVYIKQFDKENGMGTLYIKDGNKRSKRIDILVRKIVA